MKNILILLAISFGIIMTACEQKVTSEIPADSENPFFAKWNAPFGSPPFDKIEEDHYLPAVKKGIEENEAEIKAIVDNEEEPTFENTIVAMEKSGDLLDKVLGVFDNLSSSMTNENMQAISKEIAPLTTKLSDDIYLNEKLFARIKSVYDNQDKFDLDPVEKRLLKKYYDDFVRGGALLDDKQKEELREINKRLAVLTLEFGENVLKETNKYEMVIEDEKDLAGLPQSVIDAGAEEAKSRGYEGKWVYTIQKPSFIPFITYADNRELRKEILTAYQMMGNHDDELDNNKLAAEIAQLRVKKAHLLGFETHADFILVKNMAKNPETVYELLYKIWKPALANAKVEAAELRKIIDREGGDFELAPWDWWYYSEKLRKEKYDLADEELRPYFKLENVIDGAFGVATKLWGITFEERDDIPVYHEDVKVFEVKDVDGSHIGLLLTDYFPRESKRGGAWMNPFRPQSNLEGNEVTPIISNVCNFTKPTTTTPSLLTLEEVQTLFHEFGHALHGLLSDCEWPSLAGTAVSRDFVELPSQIMEHWATEPEVLKMYAKHYETGEVIPDELIEKISKSSKFNQGFVTTEFLAAAILDMDWHTMKTPELVDARKFEAESIKKMGLIDEIVVRYKTPYFRHIFSGGYSAGYYSYIWSAVLDADAFAAFKETSLFDQETAKKYRENILAKGNSEDPMELYVKFRGREPEIEPLLEKRGLTGE